MLKEFKKEIKNRIEDLRFHLETLRTIYEITELPSVKDEIRATIRYIKELKILLHNIYLTELKLAYPNADVLSKKQIISVINEYEFNVLFAQGKLKLANCGLYIITR